MNEVLPKPLCLKKKVNFIKPARYVKFGKKKKIGLHAGYMKLTTQKEEWISICIIMYNFTSVFLYIMCNKNILIIIRTFYRKSNFNMDTVSLFLAHFYKISYVIINKEVFKFSKVLWRSSLALPGKQVKRRSLIWEVSVGNATVLLPALIQRVSVCSPDPSGRAV